MNPYKDLPDKAFWKLAVAEKSLFDIDDLWEPKFNIQEKQAIVIYGSCFTQAIGKGLQKQGYHWLISEPSPPGCNKQLAQRFGYNISSARTGNLYTTSMLKQWLEWAIGKKEIADEYWEKDGRYYDPFRPRVEPNGFESEKEMKFSRDISLRAFKASIQDAKYFFFTLSLTESWFNDEQGYEYPMCPGTIAGTFDASKHKFVNQGYEQVKQNLLEAIALIVKLNPSIKIIFEYF